MRRFLFAALSAVFLSFTAAGAALAQDMTVDLPPGETLTIIVDGVETSVTAGSVIPAGAEVSLGADATGSLTLALADGTTVGIAPGSTVSVSVTPSGSAAVTVVSGSVDVAAGPGSTAQVTLPDGTTASGDEMSVSVSDDGSSQIEATGSTPVVVATTDGGSVEVSAGASLVAQPIDGSTTTATVVETTTDDTGTTDPTLPEVVTVVENANQTGSQQTPTP